MLSINIYYLLISEIFYELVKHNKERKQKLACYCFLCHKKYVNKKLVTEVNKAKQASQLQ